MSFYTDRVMVQPFQGDWLLETPLVWEVGKKGSGLQFKLQPGFKTDLASVPWWARPLFNPADGRYAKAAILHDAMLAEGYAPATAAAEFFEALKADGVSTSRATIMGLAVLIHASNH